jgi:hypothetical protein
LESKGLQIVMRPGFGNDVYRGMGRNIGCQAVYDKGRLIDSGSELGTIDYGRPIVLWGDHGRMDINKHGGFTEAVVGASPA